MDWCALLEVLVLLLTSVLQIVNGFSIRATNRNQDRGPWSHDVDRTPNIKDRMHFANFPQGHNSIKIPEQNLHQPVFAPEDSFLYNKFASLNGRDDNFKDSLTRYSTGSDDISYDKGISDNNDRDVENGEDEIDVIATISYPQKGMPALDNLSLSTKIGLLAVPSKRQQGWYVQYGKRTTARDFSKETVDHSNLNNYDEMKAKSKTSMMPFPEQSGDESIVEPSKFRLNLELSRKLQQLENDLKLRNIAYDIVKSVIDDKSKSLLESHSSVKRQQGWFTQYGKRSSEGIENYFS